jgi:hypothetical protein
LKDLFEIKNGLVVYSPIALSIKEFKAIWDRDKSKDKELANLELSYVCFVTDFRSVYKAYDEVDRSNKIIQDLFPKYEGWKPDKVVKAAIDKYKEMSRTSLMDLSDAVDHAVRKFGKYFWNVDFLALDDRGKPIYVAKDFGITVKHANEIVDSVRELKLKVEREVNETSSLRGGKEKSIFEDG